MFISINMKKYLLTALLWVFGLFTAFASADSVDWFTSDSEICKVSNFNGDSISNTVIFDCYNEELAWELQYESFYVCVNTSDIPYYAGDENNYVDNSIGCFYSSAFSSDEDIKFYSDNNSTIKTIQWNVYLSTSPITYSSSSEWWSNSWNLLPDWVWNLTWIISSLSTTLNEFIPYLVYVWLWIISALIWFVAIKRLINWIRAKIFSSFSSWRRRR